MNYLLDTNIVIIYSKNGKIAKQIEKDYRIFAREHNLAISIVTLAEINSIAHQLRITGKRRDHLDRMLGKIYQIDISSKDILQKYEEIDAYSQGKHRTIKSPFSAKNMGKNDIWIAATASALNIPLITTDKDFTHLNGVFLQLVLVDIAKYKQRS